MSNLSFEAKFRLTSDKLRNNLDAAKYKPVLIELVFFTYSRLFEEQHQKQLARLVE